MSRKVIEITGGVARHPLYRMACPIDFVLCEGEQLVILGANGSGKTMLVNTLTGRYPLLMNEVCYDFGEDDGRMVCDNLRYIAFCDSYGEYGAGYYYQQRWNSQDVETSPVVRDQFASWDESSPYLRTLFDDFDMAALMDKQTVMLSSGELRKLQIVKALMFRPQVLVIDNPFIGLDAQMRCHLQELLQRLITERGLQLILVVSREDEIPDFITHVVPVSERVVGKKIPWKGVRGNVLCAGVKQYAGASSTAEEGEVIIDFRNISLRYGARTIFENLCWEVRRGQRWALHGRNGSGKSALLSLVCADNPQAYACDIHLFGHRRGSGESIWDIKRRIGYVSPEMHRAYMRDIPCLEIVASGLHDSIGLYVKPRDGQMEVCLHWMRVFGIEELAERTFLTLSGGEQRLVLLVRAFVKDPELLILDEPLHGLDETWREKVRTLIDDYCMCPNKTLIMVTHYPEELPQCITHHKIL